jgi:hypothetical protein
MFADRWLKTGLISQDVRVAPIFHGEGNTHIRLQILDAHSNFLEQITFAAAPLTFSIPGIGLPLDSLRPNNVTYSAFDTHVCARADPSSRLELVRRRLWQQYVARYDHLGHAKPPYR